MPYLTHTQRRDITQSYNFRILQLGQLSELVAWLLCWLCHYRHRFLRHCSRRRRVVGGPIPQQRMGLLRIQIESVQTAIQPGIFKRKEVNLGNKDKLFSHWISPAPLKELPLSWKFPTSIVDAIEDAKSRMMQPLWSPILVY